MLGSLEISVGVASGLIAIAITLVTIVVPNALVLLLVAVLRDEHPAVTWSVVSRTFSSSLWPVLLRSDLAASHSNPPLINFVTWMKPLTLFLISVAAIVTPMGLHEGLVLTKDMQMTTFTSLLDTSAMGYGTPPRSDLGFSRQCWGVMPVQCPGTSYVIESNATSATFVNDDYDRRVPKVLVELYQSGLALQSRSVSSYFDIQARQYEYQNRYNINGSSYLVDSFRSMGSRILDDSVYLVDGLIVDMEKGGVGFRKHTAPSGLAFGAVWDEDILFLQPETFCANANLTLEMQVTPSNAIYNSSAPNSYLVDQGGFYDINKTSPFLEDWFDDLQTTLLEHGDPSLQARAYRAGWWMNVLNMYYLNVTKPGTNRTAYMNSELGQRFAANNSFTVSEKDRLAFGSFSDLFSGIPSAFEYSNGTLDIYNNSYAGTPYYSNPFNMTTVNWTDIASLCTGSLNGDYANITNLDVRCGLLLGPGKRLDGSTSNIVEPGSWWTRPIYSCASATKVSIKTVRFIYNSSNTNTLDSIKVLSITDKVYPNETSLPIWGVETPNMKLRDLDPFYGLIAPEKQDSINLTTIRSDHLYVPASSATVWGSSLSTSLSGNDFNPGVEGPPQIWNSVYNTIGGDGADYSGATNLALLQKWLALSSNTTGAAQIVNLIWTDMATNYFTGTRSWLTPRDYMPPNLQKRQDGGSSNTGTDVDTNDVVPVQVYVRRLQYRWVYGIPAFLVLVLSIAIVAAAGIATISGRGSIQRLRHYMWSLSPGRMFGAFLFPQDGDLYSATNPWINNVGARKVRIVDEASQVKGLPLSQVQYTQLGQKEPGQQLAISSTTTAFEPGDGGYDRQRA